MAELAAVLSSALKKSTDGYSACVSQTTKFVVIVTFSPSTLFLTHSHAFIGLCSNVQSCFWEDWLATVNLKILASSIVLDCSIFSTSSETEKIFHNLNGNRTGVLVLSR